MLFDYLCDSDDDLDGFVYCHWGLCFGALTKVFRQGRRLQMHLNLHLPIHPILRLLGPKLDLLHRLPLLLPQLPQHHHLLRLLARPAKVHRPPRQCPQQIPPRQRPRVFGCRLIDIYDIIRTGGKDIPVYGVVWQYVFVVL